MSHAGAPMRRVARRWRIASLPLGGLLASLLSLGLPPLWCGPRSRQLRLSPLQSVTRSLCASRACVAGDSDFEGEDEDEPRKTFLPDDVGRRVRTFFKNNQLGGQTDFEYATVLEVHGGPGPEQEVALEFDGEGKVRLKLEDLGRFSWLGDDIAADLAANLREFRMESIDGCVDCGATHVFMGRDQVEKEVEALAWLRQETAARLEEAEELRRENEELKRERDEFRLQYPQLFEGEGEGELVGEAEDPSESSPGGRTLWETIP
mmetsp:Transcript_89168/g.288303  ORF Transcript_89168/g.288303 Transcript_89168/m.288303 type:complete len:263 (-) Transcript_89168:40-828(-)